MAGLLAIIEDNKFTSADIPEFESKLFFEGTVRDDTWFDSPFCFSYPR